MGIEEKLKEIERRYQEIEKKLYDEKIYKNPELLNRYVKERGELSEIVETYRRLKEVRKNIAETETLLKDEEMKELAEEEIEKLKEEEEKLHNKLLLLLIPEDPRDKRNAIMEIRAAAGGEEAALFAADLFRMYAYYAEKRGWKIEIMDSHPTDLGGYKEIIFSVIGKGAYGDLKFESGVHRVQRVPVTEASGRIHTSTVTVAVFSEVEDIDVKIDPEDLRIDVFRASGHGGQCVQKTESAVRITHIPTGIVVTCQNERSQLQNKENALKVLKARLLEIKQTEQAEKLAELKGEFTKAEWGSQIRSYILHPYQMVKDHRTNYEVGNAQSVLDGNIDDFIQAYLQATMGNEKTES